MKRWEADKQAWRARAKRYYESNKKEILAQCKRYRQENAGTVASAKKSWCLRNSIRKKKADKDWSARNRQRVIARVAKWALENPERAKAHRRASKLRRRAREVSGAIHRFCASELALRIEAQGSRCAYCGADWSHVDHLKPLSKGGSTCLANLKPACADCNLRKHAMDPYVWLLNVPLPKQLPLP